MKALIMKASAIRIKLTRCRKPETKPLLKWISVVLIFAVLNLTIGCRSYFKVRTSVVPSSEKIAAQKDGGKTIIIHYQEKKWTLTNVQVKNQIVTGTKEAYIMLPTIKPVRPDRPNHFRSGGPLNQQYLLKEVHLYLSDLAETGTDQVTIPVSSIVKVEIYDYDTGATVGSWLLGAVGLAVLAIIIVVLTKQSCPFIYTDDGENYQFAGEVYSGSIHKPIERNDYLRLPTYSGRNSYSLKITNEVREVQNTNLFELLVVDHPLNTEILIDKAGKITSLRNPLSPLSARSLSGENVTKLINSKDNLFYQSDSRSNELPLKDGVIMEFPGQGSSKVAKVAIRAKNSIILDYSLGQFYDMFGSAYNGFMKKQQRSPASELRQWSMDQGIPLSLFVERNGKWDFVDYYNIAGPMKFKDDILSIPLKGDETNPLRVKLEFGNFLWEIDYAAVDYSANESVSTHFLQAKSAVTEEQKDVTKFIVENDKKYYKQPSMTNQAVITFDLPQSAKENRSIFLHTKGWYQVLHNPKGKPDLEKLRAFRQPGHFNQFVNEQVKAMEQLVALP